MEELKDLVIQTLDTNGILDKIRAQLRANVFRSIETQDAKDSSEDGPSEIESAMGTDEGKMAVELIRDFLERYKCQHTLDVFVPEAKLPASTKNTSFVCEKLKLKSNDSKSLLQQAVAKRGEKENAPATTLSSSKALPSLKLPPMDSSSPRERPEKPKMMLMSSDEEDISEEIEEDFSEPQQSAGAVFVESMGTSSMGIDASVNSMTLEGYDHVEPVSKIK